MISSVFEKLQGTARCGESDASCNLLWSTKRQRAQVPTLFSAGTFAELRQSCFCPSIDRTSFERVCMINSHFGRTLWAGRSLPTRAIPSFLLSVPAPSATDPEWQWNCCPCALDDGFVLLRASCWGQGPARFTPGPSFFQNYSPVLRACHRLSE